MIKDIAAGAIMALALSAQPGCALPRADLAECQDIGLFDPIPHECWGDEDAQRLSKIDSAHQSARRLAYIPRGVDTLPAPWLIELADGGDWQSVPGAPQCIVPDGAPINNQEIK